MMNRASLVVAVLIFCFSALSTHGQAQCAACATGHWYVSNPTFPMLEDHSIEGEPGMYVPSPITVTYDASKPDEWVIVQDSCASELQRAGAFHVFLRAYLYIENSTAPAGTEYEVQILTVNRFGNLESVRGTFRRKLRGGISKANPQGDYFASHALNVPSGSWNTPGYGMRVRVRLKSAGSITFKYQFTTAHGTPTQYGGAQLNTTSQTVIDGTWRVIGTLQFTNASQVPVAANVQTSFRYVSGSAGQPVYLGFGRENLSSGSHNFNLYVPAAVPDSITLFDHLPNEGVGGALFNPDNPATTANEGIHNIRIWARTGSGTVTIDSLQAAVIAVPVTADTLLVYAARSDERTVSVCTMETQPQNCVMQDRGSTPTQDVCTPATPGCGKWTKIMEIDVPASPASDANYSVGNGYIEIKRRSAGTWGSSKVHVAVETVTKEPTPHVTDFHWAKVYVPPGSSQVFFFTDAMSWGNVYGQTLRLWMRKDTCEDSDPDAAFVVGKTFLNIRFFANPNSCLYH